MSKNYQIPFDENGNQLSYPDYWMNGYQNREVILKDNFTFQDKLIFIEFQRGRSSALAKFKRENACTYVTMFLSDLEECFEYFNKGIIKGRFTFVKKGMNYGTKFLEAV